MPALPPLGSSSPRLLLLFTSFLALTSSGIGAAEEEPAPVLTVEPGQTVWSIAHARGVAVEDLLQANHIDDPTDVFSGQQLTIPGGQAAFAPPAPGEGGAIPAFVWPLSGRLTSRYGRRGRTLHSGLDIAATPGTIIVAAADGKVARAERRWGRYGKVVLIEHAGSFTTLYAHASRTFVREGQSVQRGQAIAAVGRTGNATGPHLHFEVWAGDRTRDPLRFLDVDPGRMSALLKR